MSCLKRSTPSGAHSGLSSIITSPSPPPPGDATVSVTVLPPSAEAGDTATPVQVRKAQWRGGGAASAAPASAAKGSARRAVARQHRMLCTCMYRWRTCSSGASEPQGGAAVGAARVLRHHQGGRRRRCRHMLDAGRRGGPLQHEGRGGEGRESEHGVGAGTKQGTLCESAPRRSVTIDKIRDGWRCQALRWWCLPQGIQSRHHGPQA